MPTPEIIHGHDKISIQKFDGSPGNLKPVQDEKRHFTAMRIVSREDENKRASFHPSITIKED